MSKNRFEMLEVLINNLGVEEALNALVSAMSDDDMKENYEYICRCYEITDTEDEIEDFEWEEEFEEEFDDCDDCNSGYFIMVVENGVSRCEMSCSTKEEAEEIIKAWKQKGIVCYLL